jgi:hypothetical protein
MGHPPVVVVESGGVPRTQVDIDTGSAPPFTVVESGARPITLAENAPPIALLDGDGSPFAGYGYAFVIDYAGRYFVDYAGDYFIMRVL